jgi:homopolymeric O-antigen transport system ATP-binding protein
MKTNSIIKVDNLGKQYRLGVDTAPYSTIREVVMDALKAPLRSLRRNGSDPTIWALRDVSFEIQTGEIVGIIGRNGAGKSTLLKILSRITHPTIGRVQLFGRVASLLEVGTGFHPELTGRENIFLNGSILGMSKTEIESKFDEIIAFAEIEKFIDTPVKRYSSGMYVRLAFAVAAHLEPEILVIDEVLAVGDMSFQKKCLGKMKEVATQGRTVLFVSHNMGAVARLCQSGMLLSEGRLIFKGDITETINRYAQTSTSSDAEISFPPNTEKILQMSSAKLLDQTGKPSTELDRNESFTVTIDYEVRAKTEGAHLGIMLDRIDGTPICYTSDIDSAPEGSIDRKPGSYRATVTFPGGLLNAGVYQIRLGLARYGGEIYDYCEPFVFHLEDRGTFATFGSQGHQRQGILALPLDWQTTQIK